MRTGAGGIIRAWRSEKNSARLPMVWRRPSASKNSTWRTRSCASPAQCSAMTQNGRARAKTRSRSIAERRIDTSRSAPILNTDSQVRSRTKFSWRSSRNIPTTAAPCPMKCPSRGGKLAASSRDKIGAGGTATSLSEPSTKFAARPSRRSSKIQKIGFSNTTSMCSARF